MICDLHLDVFPTNGETYILFQTASKGLMNFNSEKFDHFLAMVIVFETFNFL